MKREDFRLSWGSIKKLLALGIPMGLQFSITAIGTIIVQGAVNVYGAVYMAGFAAGAKVQNMIVTVFASLGATLATYTGQNWGAGKLDRVKKGVRYTQILVLVWSVVMMVVVYFFGQYMVLLFVSASEVGVFELVARGVVVMIVAGKASFVGVCLSDPAAWLAALIPLIPYYVYMMRKIEKKRIIH